MAPVSAVLLVTALIAAFACCFNGAQVLMELHAHRKEPARGSLEIADELGKRFRALPFLKDSLERAETARREALFKKQMPDAIRLLCIALDAGSSLVKALEYAAYNTEAPLADELKRTVWDLQAGQGFDEAMVHLRSRTGGSEFAYLAVAMEIQHRSGGSLSDVLQTISGSLRKSAELDESLKTQTTQGRLSARIVAVMPVIIVCVFSLLTPGYLSNFVSSPIGAVMLFFALMLELGGILWVRRTLDVDLSSHLGGESA